MGRAFYDARVGDDDVIADKVHINEFKAREEKNAHEEKTNAHDAGDSFRIREFNQEKVRKGDVNGEKNEERNEPVEFQRICCFFGDCACL